MVRLKTSPASSNKHMAEIPSVAQRRGIQPLYRCFSNKNNKPETPKSNPSDLLVSYRDTLVLGYRMGVGQGRATTKHTTFRREYQTKATRVLYSGPKRRVYVPFCFNDTHETIHR